MGWQEQDLTARRKGDPAKVKLAAAVRAQTTLPRPGLRNAWRWAAAVI